MKIKLKVKQILESAFTKDDVCYYKIEWEQTWLPSKILQEVQYLIDSFWRAEKKPVKTTPEDEESCKDRRLSPCFFCKEDISVDTLHHHEKEHVGKSTSVDITESLKIESPSERGILMFTACHDVEEIENSSEVVNYDTTRDLDDTTETSSCPNMSVEDIPESSLYAANQEEGLPEFLCPKCNKCFSSFGQFRLHYHYHRPNGCFECDTCQRKFVSKELFDKHHQIHVDSNRRQKSYGKNLTSTKKLSLRRPLLAKGQTLPPSALDVMDSSLSVGVGVLPKKKRGRKKKEQSVDKKKRGRPDDDFTPDVLRSARQYIKAVSKRRKEIKMMRLSADTANLVTNRLTGLGVDVELEKCEDAMPILSNVDGRQGYGCKVCGKVFYNKFHHREHYNVHSGEMPYECEFCRKRFAQRSGWNRHIKLHHKYEVFSGPLPRAFEKLALNYTDRRVSEPKHDVGTEIPLTPGINRNIETAINNVIIMRGNDPPAGNVPITTSHFFHHPSNAINSSVHGVFTYVQASMRAPTTALPAHAVPLQFDGKKQGDEQKKQTVFQCKKVRSIHDQLIFMIRYGAKHEFYDKEFAYILDGSGHVSGRIYVDDYPGGDWTDFPLDETANDVLLLRIQHYDAQNKRGPRPGFLASDKRGPRPGFLASKDVHNERGNVETRKVVVNPHGNDAQSPSKASDTADLPLTSSQHEEFLRSQPSNMQEQGVMSTQKTTPVQLKATHGRSFRSGREKRFLCTVCGRKFLAQAHLNDHMLIHTGELPYKCMFCARPFRHKSALNCHHKRHIQKGVFNRPISGSKNLSKNASDESSENQSMTDQTKLNTNGKPKRKGRKPKQVKKRAPVENIISGHDNLYGVHIKAEEGIDIGENNENGNEFTHEGATDGFECNFCSMTFPMRTAYLKHVNAVHKGSGNSKPPSSPSLFNDREYSSEFQRKEIIDESLADLDVRMDVLCNHDVEHLFPDIKIKEEVIDDF